MKKYILNNGREITVMEHEGKGMAEEPMTYLLISNHANQIVRFDDIKDLMSAKDRRELYEWIRHISDSNYNSAISFCK